MDRTRPDCSGGLMGFGHVLHKMRLRVGQGSAACGRAHAGIQRPHAQTVLSQDLVQLALIGPLHVVVTFDPVKARTRCRTQFVGKGQPREQKPRIRQKPHRARQ